MAVGKGSSPVNPVTGQPDPLGTHQDTITRLQWALDLLDQANLPVTPNNVATVVCWCQFEGTAAKFNPMATTQPAKGATNFNSVGVKNYPDYKTGLIATANTLKQAYYKQVVADLKADRDYGITCRDIAASPWGSKPIKEALLLKASHSKIEIAPPFTRNGYWYRISSPYIGGGDKAGSRTYIPPDRNQSALMSGINDIEGALGSTADFLGKLTDPHTWYRVGQVLFGIILLVIALAVFAKKSGVTDTIVHVASHGAA